MVTKSEAEMIRDTEEVLEKLDCLDDWDCKFIIDLHKNYLPRSRPLSSKQRTKLDSIWDKVCASPH